MKKLSLKRILAGVICAAVLISDIPAQVLANDTTYEAADYGIANGYTEIEGDAYGACVWDHDYASRGKNGMEYLPTNDELIQNMDRTMTPYVAYIVNAEVAGTYKIALLYESTSAARKYEMTMLINGVVYTGESGEEVEVTLRAGDNIVYCIPYTRNSVTGARFGSGGTVNQKGLEVPANQGLTVRANEKTQLQPAASSYFSNYTANDDGSLRNSLTSNLKYITIETLKPENMKYLSYYSYTVEAPANGTYGLEWQFAVVEVDDNENPVTKYNKGNMGLMIDGVAQAVPYDIDVTGTSTTGVFVELTEGEHVITVFQHMPKDAAATADYLVTNNNVISADSVAWTDQISLSLYGGLELAREQRDPSVDVSDRLIKITPDYADINGYRTQNSDIVGDCMMDFSSAVIDNLQTEDEIKQKINNSKTPFIMFAVDASAAGEYYVQPQYDLDTDGKVASAYYMTVLVNGTDIYHMTKFAPVKVQLQEGRNTINLLQYTVESQTALVESGQNAGWMNITGLLVQEDLTPVKLKLQVIEAEDDEYVYRNLFGIWENKEKQYEVTASGEYVVGDMDIHLIDQTYEDLGTWIDKTDLPYIATIVTAPADGTYQVRSAYVFSCGAIDEYREKYGNPYMTVLVNGNDTYKAEFNGNNGVIDATTIDVTLKKGRNVLYFIPFTQDQIEGVKGLGVGEPWANIDYVAFDGALTCEKYNLSVAEAENAEYSGNFYYVGENEKASGGKFLAGASQGIMAEAGITVETLTQDVLRKTPHFAYTIDVPADGYYDISVGFATEGQSNTFGVLVDGVSYAAPFGLGDHGYDRYDRLRADASVYLTKGTHILAVTTEMPVNAAAGTGYGWSDLDALYLSGGITISKTQKNPYDREKLTYIEAETMAYPNLYTSVQKSEKYSGGAIVGGANAYKQPSSGAMKMLDVHEQDYVEYIVEAPSDGYYNVKVGIEFGSSKEMPAENYVILYVNGVAQKLKFSSKSGEVVSIPASVELVKGRNVIRVTGTLRDYAEATNFAVWCNHDYLAVPEGVVPIDNSKGGTRLEAEKAAYMNQFKVAERGDASGGAILGNSTPSAVVAGVSSSNLSLDNFEAASYVSFTVNAPQDGYYTIYGRMFLLGGNGLGNVGLIVDSKAYAMPFWQNQWGGQNPAEATVYMTAGEHRIIITGLLADSFANKGDAAWMDYDYFTLGGGLTVAKNHKKPTTSTKYTRFEMEDVAMTNRYYLGYDWDMSNLMAAICKDGTGAQSYAEIEAEGLNGVVTPYIQLSADAPSAGTYKVRLAVAYKYNGEEIGGETEFAIFVNDQLQKFTLPIYNREYCKPFPIELELKLNEGLNNVVITHGLAHATYGECLVNTHFDYIDTTSGLVIAPIGERLEAEMSEYSGYTPTAEPSCSGQMSLMHEDWDSVYSNDITFDKLNEKTYKNVPYVEYTVVAEKAGTYYFGAGINAGGNCVENEVFIGLRVNDGEFQKLSFYKMWQTCALFKVELQEGENKILLTGSLKDFLNYPEYPGTAGSTNMWCDHDYLNLPAGVTSVHAEAIDLFAGDADADYHDSLSSVWGDFTGALFEKAEEFGWGKIAAGAGIGVLAIVAVVLCIVFGKKKKDKTEAGE